MKRHRLSDKAYVCLNLQPFTATTQFYVSRKYQKKYSGTILNEGGLEFDVQIESMSGYYSLRRTLPPGESLDFQNYPLSGITFYGQGVFTVVGWASDHPIGYVRTTARKTINVGNFPPFPAWPPGPFAVTQSGAWNVGVNNFPAGFNCLNFPASYPVTGTFWQATQPVSGTVDIGNFPANYAINNFPAGFNVNNWPATFAATQSGIWSVGVNNFPATYPATQSGIWSVGVNNFPAGFNCLNFPASYPVTGTFWQATQPVSGTFWQATQPVSGTFWQATQPISGSVSVSNFPAGPFDVSDRAARLLGVVYGSQGQPLQQRNIGGLDFPLGVSIGYIAGTPVTASDWSIYLKTLTDNTDTDKYRVIPMAKGKTRISKSASQGGIGQTTIYTVTNGKTFYLVFASIGANCSTLALGFESYIEADVGGNGVFSTITLLVGYSNAFAYNVQTAPCIPIPFPQNTVIRIRGDAANTGQQACITGWEE